MARRRSRRGQKARFRSRYVLAIALVFVAWVVFGQLIDAQSIDIAGGIGVGLITGAIGLLLLRLVRGIQTKLIRRSGDLQALQRMDPIAFEHWVADRFREMGWTVQGTATTGDHGIDLVMFRGGTMAVVQCKRYSGTVGEEVVRSLWAAMHDKGARRGFLVTTGRISQPARFWAMGKPLDLWDGDRITRMRD